MKLAAIALDYDGTLTLDGRLSRTVVDTIGRVRCRGIRVLLVTGRRLGHLAAETELGMFDAIVAENGAVIDFPWTGRHVQLGHTASEAFIHELARRGVPFVCGECVIETDAALAVPVLEVVRALELPYILSFNRGRLMVLPPGVAKSTGLRSALFELQTSMHNTIAIGDAENDHDLLDACELGVAVAWGSAALRAIADEIVEGHGPDAVAAYVDRISSTPRLAVGRAGRHRVPLGTRHNGEPVSLGIRGRTVIIAGEPGSGKSLLAGALCEQFVLQGYSLAVLDPEGDYRSLEGLPNVTMFGGEDPPPPPRQVLHTLRHPGETLVIDLSRLGTFEKQQYLRTMLPILAAERRRTGLPHKIVVDEAHQFLAGPETPALIDPELGGYIWVTYRVSQLHPSVCAQDAVRIVTRESEPSEVAALSLLCGAPIDPDVLGSLEQDEAVLLPGPDEAHGDMVRFRVAARLTPHVRHRQKYFDMPVAEAQAFVFADGAGPGARVRSFRELVGVLTADPAPRLRGHCERHDFSRWVRDVFLDGRLAARLHEIEGRAATDDPRCVAEALAQAIRARYEFRPWTAAELQRQTAASQVS
jgi:hydroxymethylpyrimidine pyrophosphatase-like HAD family hydrolase